MEAALESLKLLKLGEKPNYIQVAKKYSVKRLTLSHRYRRVQGSCIEKVNISCLLNATQESKLIRYIDNLYIKGLPFLRQIIWNFIAELVEKELGKNWVNYFILRHRINLVI